MNIAEHALKMVEAIKPVKRLTSKESKAILENGINELALMLNDGGNISTIADNFGVTHHVVMKHIDSLLGKGSLDKARANGFNRKLTKEKANQRNGVTA